MKSLRKPWERQLSMWSCCYWQSLMSPVWYPAYLVDGVGGEGKREKRQKEGERKCTNNFFFVNTLEVCLYSSAVYCLGPHSAAQASLGLLGSKASSHLAMTSGRDYSTQLTAHTWRLWRKMWVCWDKTYPGTKLSRRQSFLTWCSKKLVLKHLW